MKESLRGFTVVELVITIVVIGILASISLVAYNGSQARARDAVRADHIAKIKDALEVYYAKNGRYPNATATPSVDAGWEASTQDPGTFLEQLYGYGVDEKTIDPINDSTYRYRYYRYPTGNRGCAGKDAPFYVLVAKFETEKMRPPIQPFEPNECTTPNGAWSTTDPTAFVFRVYEAD